MPFMNFLNSSLNDTIPFILSILFIVLCVLLFINRKYFRAYLKLIDKKTGIILILIFCFALLLRIFIPPLQHIMYTDEAWYMEAAKNIVESGTHGEYMKSLGWPFFLSLCFRIFGINNYVALFASILLGALTIFPVFFISYILFRKKILGLVSSILFSLLPLHIRWSSTAETNVASLFFVSLTICLFLLYFKKKKNTLLWLSLVSFAFTAHFRPENYSLILLFFFGIFLFFKPIYRWFNLKRVLLIILLSLLILPNLVHVLDFQTSTNWLEKESSGNIQGSNWSFQNFVYNSRNYGSQLFNGDYYPLLISIFFILGLLFALKENNKDTLFLLFWFILLWSIYFSSWFQTLGGNTRFFLSFYPLFSIFSSFGIFKISHILESSLKIKNLERVSIYIFTLGILILCIPYFDIAAQHYKMNGKILETRLPELAKKDISPNCTIVAILPVLLSSTTHLNVIPAETFVGDELLKRSVFESSSCVLFYEGYCCLDWGEPSFQNICKEIKNTFLTEEFKAYSYKGTTYRFYKLNNE